jgi:hypothetical protein
VVCRHCHGVMVDRDQGKQVVRRGRGRWSIQLSRPAIVVYNPSIGPDFRGPEASSGWAGWDWAGLMFRLSEPWGQLKCPQDLGMGLPSTPSTQNSGGDGPCNFSAANLAWQCPLLASGPASLCRRPLHPPWPQSPGWWPE